MEKQILKRGYITNALTTQEGKILGLVNDYYVNFDTIKDENIFYWSEVYCEPGYMATIIRKGICLANSSSEELDEYLKQSKINLL